jgi:hypothetical protein
VLRDLEDHRDQMEHKVHRVLLDLKVFRVLKDF